MNIIHWVQDVLRETLAFKAAKQAPIIKLKKASCKKKSKYCKKRCSGKKLKKAA